MFLIVFLLGQFSQLALAQCPGSQPTDTDCVAYGASKVVDKHTVCRSVTNNHASTKAIMVPVKTSSEWSSFYTNPPAGVTANACASCTGTPWGTVAHGYSNTAYQFSSVCGCASYSQTRTCSNGTMSGTFTFTSCTESCGTSTTGSGAGATTAGASTGGNEN